MAKEGLNTVNVNFADKPAGVYFVILKQGNNIKQLKLIRE
jgi:hypothetical protein